MVQKGGYTLEEFDKILPYLLVSLKPNSPQNNNPRLSINSEESALPLQVQNSFISNILKQKLASLNILLQKSSDDIQHTNSLERALLSYVDSQIIKVENRLLQIDFTENFLHKDVIPLRVQMQQQLFQLEQEKVRTRVSLNNQVIQLTREYRTILRDLHDVERQLRTFE